ncbi:uncharacterized protein A1O5_01594 [Cladophialophora psammophila CBS 110553]|uniref:Alcohol dehydrogenase n=1 Tax=Cladophialophora psammophila CBS 110553 TaxID=1182543 RepID=W9X3Z7_9EURO|nr:uncharacterized protein A1O5_01594 [Cladophialophora psammophila CBS 110553]EXJ74898.1 hypothetical protein A1O5_01594 [Cladophialophora psammophila CBS 110553]
MPPLFYQPQEPVDCLVEVDSSALKGKTSVITGGFSGLGYAYAKAFVEAGAFVVIADIQPPPSPFKESEAVFVKCDVTIWADQLAVFEIASQLSPNGKIDVVIANAGVAGPDVLTGVFCLDDPTPQEPMMKMLDVNVKGVLYTTKLAGWYFRHHHDNPLDGCLILVSSIMGYIDTQSSAVYAAAKFSVRGLMCCLRRKGVFRVNAIAPWFIATPMMSEDFLEMIQTELRNMGLDLASIQDSVNAVLRIATDASMNGRCLAIVPRQLSPSGYMDLGLDDIDERTPAGKMQKAASSIPYNKFRHALS